MGPERHPSVPRGVLLLRGGGQRGGRRRHAEPRPGHEERACCAHLRRAGPRKGHHVGLPGHPQRLQPALGGTFTGEADAFIGPVVLFLASAGSPLMANIYPYLAWAYNPSAMDMIYALFTASGTALENITDYCWSWNPRLIQCGIILIFRMTIFMDCSRNAP